MAQNKSDKCSNCGIELLHEENFCPNCGQKNTDLNLSIIEVLKDFGGDYFTFDSKLFKTLGPLIIKPGKVPKEYIDGKRMSHIPPLRVFIFLSFVTFFLWGLSFKNSPFDESSNEFAEGDSTEVSLKNPKAILDSINDANFVDLTIGPDSNKSDSVISSDLLYMLDKKNDPKAVADSIAGDSSVVLKHLIFQAVRMYQAEKGSVTKYFLGNLSLVLLLLQPFFALLLKLFYIRRKSFFYIEHLVFSLYFHAFILLATTILYFLSFIVETEYLFLWLILVSMLYLFLAIKRFYEQSWVKSFFKTGGISFFYLAFIFPIFMVAYFLLSLYFY
jgi:hypothetical protein